MQSLLDVKVGEVYKYKNGESFGYCAVLGTVPHRNFFVAVGMVQDCDDDKQYTPNSCEIVDGYSNNLLFKVTNLDKARVESVLKEIQGLKEDKVKIVSIKPTKTVEK